MKRNVMRIVSNPYTNQVSYYYKNELEEWNILSEDSILSRQYFTNATMKEKGEKIVKKLDEIYNRKNKGLDIIFEGTTKSYEYFDSAIKLYLADRDITCKLGTTRIAVVGKKSVGKTCLIESLQELSGYKYSSQKKKGYEVFSDECNHAEWYEVNGIDLGIENVEKAYRTIKDLSKKGISAVIYCLSSDGGRIEEAERELIKMVEKEFSEVTIMIAFTMCYKGEEEIQYNIDELLKLTNQMKIVPVLAKAYKTKRGDMILPFGLQEILKYVFEGK